MTASGADCEGLLVFAVDERSVAELPVTNLKQAEKKLQHV